MADGRATKRLRLDNGDSRPRHVAGASRTFAPFRTVGLVSPTALPFTSVSRGKTTFQITTSVGRRLHTYDLRRGFHLIFVTQPHTPAPITATAAWQDHVLAAFGGERREDARGGWIFCRGQHQATLEWPREIQENISKFCVFGSWIVGVFSTVMCVWNRSTYACHTTLQGTSPAPFGVCISSLPTFLNKILVGREDGSAEIWNVSSGKLVHTILPPSTAYGAVTAIEPTPALSLVAIAYFSGPLLIHDVCADQTVIKLRLPSGAPATSISFRTDGLGAGDDGHHAGVMATACTESGDVTLWDLNNSGRHAGILRAAHASPNFTTPGGVTNVQFLPGQAILLTSGRDNSLKSWIFDTAPFSPIPRLLHQRSGPGGPISRLLFLPTASDGADDEGKWLLAAGEDRSLWGWSLRRDGQSTALSQGNVQSKAKKQGLLSHGGDSPHHLQCPPITAIACSLNRDGGFGAVPGKQRIWQTPDQIKGKRVAAEVSSATGWESVVTAHLNDCKARTWFWGRKRAGRWTLATSDGGHVTAVAMTGCGTFALVGSDKGGIDLFNLQSGLHRQRFPPRLKSKQVKQMRIESALHRMHEEEDETTKKKLHRGFGENTAAVTGLSVDALNKTVVSADSAGKVKFWDFATGFLRSEIDWSDTAGGITGMAYHRSSNLAAFACADGCMRVIDVQTERLVRELWPSRPTLSFFAGLPFAHFSFSADGHWITAAMGPIVLLWDLPTGQLIDAWKLPAECTTLAFSPTSEFLAMAMKGRAGIDIWYNRTLFARVSTRHLDAADLERIVASAEVTEPSMHEESRGALIVTRDDKDDHVDDVVGGERYDGGNIDESYDSADLSSNLLSLSLLPKARWQNLLYLDLIRARNKPVEPPQRPKNAPFFLPSLSQDRPSVASSALRHDRDITNIQEQSRVFKLSGPSPDSQSSLSAFLRPRADTANFTRWIEHLRNLSPPAADIEIRSLRTEPMPSQSLSMPSHAQDSEAILFVQALTTLLRQRRDFELVHAWMAVFLRAHGDVVASDYLQDGGEGDLMYAVREWREAAMAERERVKKLASYCGGVVGWLRTGRL